MKKPRKDLMNDAPRFMRGRCPLCLRPGFVTTLKRAGRHGFNLYCPRGDCRFQFAILIDEAFNGLVVIDCEREL